MKLRRWRSLMALMLALALLVPGIASGEELISGAAFRAMLPDTLSEALDERLKKAETLSCELALLAACEALYGELSATRAELLAMAIEAGLLEGIALDFDQPFTAPMAKRLAANLDALLSEREPEEQTELEWMANFKTFAATDQAMATGLPPAPSMSAPAPDYFDYNSLNDEGYAIRVENGFQNPADDPFSTFSLDVDTASYSNVRRSLLMGRWPDVGAVRAEEMLNYFDYALPSPKDGAPIAVSLMAGECPWNTAHRLVLVGLQSETPKELPAQNLVFLMDVSGSMHQENRLPLAQKAMKLLVNELNGGDTVAIVTYAGDVGIALEPTPCSNREKIFSAIDRLSAGGGTYGEGGIDQAYKLAQEHYLPGGNNRVILMSDGDFNIGTSTPTALKKLIEEKRESGVYLSALGFGMGNYKDDTMEALADAGNGNYAYIDNMRECKKVLADEMTSTIYTVANDVKLQVEWNPYKVAAYRLIGYENRMLETQDFTDDSKDAGEFGASSQMIALYEVIPNETGEVSGTPSRYRESSATELDEWMIVNVRYKLPGSNESAALEGAILYSGDEMSDNDDFAFAASVAELSLVLSDSEYRADASIARAAESARGALGEDIYGYRAEFVQLAELASLIEGEK